MVTVGDTVTVGDLRLAIRDLPDDMPVLGYWDGYNWDVHSIAVVDNKDLFERPFLEIDVS